MNTESINESLYRKVYAEKKELVFLTALRYVEHNEYVAEEIMQDVFEKLYFNCEKMNEEYLTGWLLKTTRNEALNYRKKAEHEIPQDNIILTMDLHESCAGPEDLLIAAEKERACFRLTEEILDRLYEINPRWYEAVIMARVFEMEYKDVAEEMRISLKSLECMLRRAKMWMNKYYGEEKDEILIY